MFFFDGKKEKTKDYKQKPLIRTSYPCFIKTNFFGDLMREIRGPTC